MVGESPVHTGRHSYVVSAQVRHWSEGAALHIGAFCSLSDGITILLGGNHTHHWMTTFPLAFAFPQLLRSTAPGLSKGDIKIGHDVWVGHGATILSGVTIGHGAVIGTKAVVAKDVAPYAIVVGNPAREVRKRFSDPIITLLLELAWWDLPDEKIATFLPDLMAEPNEDRLRALIAQYRPAP